MIHFPPNFFWGSSTSAEQSEGRLPNDGKGKTTWDYFFQTEPYKFFDGIGTEHTSQVLRYFKDDITLLKQTGHNAFRTSISWARLIPEGEGKINEQAVTFYRTYFTALKEAGIEPMVNLSHFDIPLVIQDKYDGFVGRETVNAFVQYAKTCFELFGDIVKYWFSFNEPIVSVECGYLLQYHYPLEVNPKKAVQVAFNMALASAKVVKIYHELEQGGKIGIILNLTPAYPRSNHPADLEAARIAELFATQSFLDPAVKGCYPAELVELIKKHDLLPDYTDDDLIIIKENTVDFLGINYYQPLRVSAPVKMPNPNAPFMPSYYYDHYAMPARRMNPHRGWEIYPKGLFDIAENLRKNYGNIEWIVAENGMGVANEMQFCDTNGQICDDYRIEFFSEHLQWLHKAIERGANCQGYLVWTSIDCWSWLNAYKNRYGLIALDYTTGKRTIKKSGRWFAEVAKNNGF
ncbi:MULTISPECIES: glycoside hydrolase family 1 protein [Pasteurellaceae]|uniref:Glycoside hydrolase family 1 protein n=1 Tax=Pasteurella atlantica TaxID=2827233 RepID=A0AAW8CN28_9PAST|nr:glycoside hydrolase family 1 protein [Pasteurella atlantica]MBR0573778.1 glycoside hydrolase family 1 protein [Pasteurella atlantica]MDP8039714.1 glycoside hydrolase family 1 protein [Pasteurella atlantica]MDP8041899.1 glycoside hydrolase family 1 protein [Pasteurella atlantica]MDP8044076.1 glycoside hydrolase family 1 protein [Pasteurella atlantica]MDP8046054.1 glycoside hydrolase family 1 protein [Pasteurella atlantica]